MDYPISVFIISLIGLWLAERVGSHLRRRQVALDEEEHEDVNIVLAASLTLLGLIIGFSFSMAITRYDNRKNCEEAEANAIGTEYSRAGLLPPGDVARIRRLLARYLDQRIQFYEARTEQRARQIEDVQARLQAELWSAIESSATDAPTAITALAVSGMNDVLDAQGFTQAAWWNRIPVAAWALVGAIALCSNGLFGYNARLAQSRTRLFLFLPALISVSLLLIADLDSPRGGLIRVWPKNLSSVLRSLPTLPQSPMETRSGASRLQQ
jgi:hypothetical protein